MNGLDELLDAKKATEPTLDVGNLLVEDLEPIDLTSWKRQGKAYLVGRLRDNAQYLFNSVWQLPKIRVQDSVIVQLPEPSSRIPREKPLPKPKAPTRWEEFAKLKGIQKRKKGRMVWDEEAQDWRPAWGYKRANDDTKDWIVEVPDRGDPYEDYIGKRLEAKKERVAKNELQRLKNIARSMKQSSLPNIGIGPQSKVTTKKELFEKIQRAKHATASAGVFTEPLRGEKEPKGPGKKRKFVPNEISVDREHRRYEEVLESMERKKPNVLNVDKAVRLMVQQQHEESREKNMQNGNKKKGKKKKPSGTKRGQNRYNRNAGGKKNKRSKQKR